MIELHFTEVDHVTTIWTEAPPPLRAGLLFRTGRIDETLATAGQTHLIEHLALSQLGDPSPNQDGFVGGAVTSFSKMGEPQDVASFFVNLCDALTSLPCDRLESEKQILAAEKATRHYDFRYNLLTRRYGAAGYGLLGTPEIGFLRATLEQLAEYSAQRFAKENAVLWLSGPPPTELAFRLPHGTRHPLPPLAPILQTFPGWFLDDECGGVAAGTTVPRVSTSTIFCDIASRRLHNRLRTVQAISYAPIVFYEHLNADTAHLVLEQHTRSPDAIPKPVTTPLQRIHAQLTRRYGIVTYPMIIFMLINLIIVLRKEANFKDPFVGLALVALAFAGFFALAGWLHYKP